MGDAKHKPSVSKKRKSKSTPLPAKSHRQRFNQLLDDAVLGVKKGAYFT